MLKWDCRANDPTLRAGSCSVWPRVLQVHVLRVAPGEGARPWRRRCRHRYHHWVCHRRRGDHLWHCGMRVLLCEEPGTDHSHRPPSRSAHAADAAAECAAGGAHGHNPCASGIILPVVWRIRRGGQLLQRLRQGPGLSCLIATG
jgi:hypothetical protein